MLDVIFSTGSPCNFSDEFFKHKDAPPRYCSANIVDKSNFTARLFAPLRHASAEMAFLTDVGEQIEQVVVHRVTTDTESGEYRKFGNFSYRSRFEEFV